MSESRKRRSERGGRKREIRKEMWKRGESERVKEREGWEREKEHILVGKVDSKD